MMMHEQLRGAVGGAFKALDAKCIHFEHCDIEDGNSEVALHT